MKFFSLFFLLTLVFSQDPCGDACSWTFDQTSGKLTVKGFGPMKSWSGSSLMPWNSIKPQIKSVEIQQGITTIGRYAFYRCENLESVTMADSVYLIEDGVFEYDSMLKSVHFPGGLNITGSEMFYRCTSLEKITISSSNTKYVIENNVLFTTNKQTIVLYPAGDKRTTYTIPTTVKYIGNNAFESSAYLTEVIFTNNVTSVGNMAFKEASALKKC